MNVDQQTKEIICNKLTKVADKFDDIAGKIRLLSVRFSERGDIDDLTEVLTEIMWGIANAQIDRIFAHLFRQLKIQERIK